MARAASGAGFTAWPNNSLADASGDGAVWAASGAVEASSATAAAIAIRINAV
jgi:hypothetical protein